MFACLGPWYPKRQPNASGHHNASRDDPVTRVSTPYPPFPFLSFAPVYHALVCDHPPSSSSIRKCRSQLPSRYLPSPVRLILMTQKRSTVTYLRPFSLLIIDSSYGQWMNHWCTVLKIGMLISVASHLATWPVIVPQHNLVSRLWRGSTARSPYWRGRYGIITQHGIHRVLFIIGGVIVFIAKVTVI